MGHRYFASHRLCVFCGSQIFSCSSAGKFSDHASLVARARATSLPAGRQGCGRPQHSAALHLWSRIIRLPTQTNFLDPGSRFRLLTKHRSAFHKSTKPAAGQVYVSFVDLRGVGPRPRPCHGRVLPLNYRPRITYRELEYPSKKLLPCPRGRNRTYITSFGSLRPIH